jgi:hypothetical protein
VGNRWPHTEDEDKDTQPLYRFRGEEKSSFHTSKGWSENSIKQLSLLNVKRMGGSVSADHVAGT